MKIANINEMTLGGIKKSNQTQKAKNTSKEKIPPTGANKVDHVSISVRSREIQKLGSIIAQTPDLRKEKLGELRNKINRGGYKIDPMEIAKKMLSEI